MDGTEKRVRGAGISVALGILGSLMGTIAVATSDGLVLIATVVACVRAPIAIWERLPYASDAVTHVALATGIFLFLSSLGATLTGHGG